MTRPARPAGGLAFLLLAALVPGAWLASFGVARAADGDPPTLQIRVVNDLDALALAQIRERAQEDVKLCRGLLHMPDAAPPPLPDAVLEKIVYFEDERLFRPDRLGHFNIQRSVHADEVSHCEPFVWAYRGASVTLGCDGQTVGVGHMAIETWMPGLPRPAPKPPEVKLLPEKIHPCPNAKKIAAADAAPRIDAGQGQRCVWLSELVWEHLGPLQATMAQANPGTGGTAPDPRPRHADACLLADRTSYKSSSLIGRPIELMSHWTRPTDGPPDDAAGQYLAGNTHLVQSEQGGAISDAELSPERVKSFIEMAWREPMPAGH